MERFKHDGLEYRRFNAGKAEVVYVVGEFYWRVAVGEECETEDFIHAPYMLSRERMASEVTWSIGEYLPADDVQSAFTVRDKLPRTVGVYANQPNPWEARHRGVCGLFWKFMVVAVIAQLLFLYVVAETVLKHRIVFSPTQDEVTVTTPEFVISSLTRRLAVKHATDIDNNWVSVSTTLIEKNTGKAWLGMQEIAHYSGVDGGESWSEGSRGDELVFKGVPPGTYYLAIDYELGTDRNLRVVDSIEVERNAPGWSNFVFLLVFLVVFPLFTRSRRAAFETRRWNESSLYSASDDSDDE